jgi:hypothetical protein
MKQSRAHPDPTHPFEQFKATMRKLVKVSKADLDAELRKHNETKPERRAGRKPKKKL